MFLKLSKTMVVAVVVAALPFHSYAQGTSISGRVITTYQLYKFVKFCADHNVGWMDIDSVRAELKDMDDQLPRVGLNSDHLWQEAAESADTTGAGPMFKILSPMIQTMDTLPADRQAGLQDWCEIVKESLLTNRLNVMNNIAVTNLPKENPSEAKSTQNKDF